MDLVQIPVLALGVVVEIMNLVTRPSILLWSYTNSSKAVGNRVVTLGNA